MTGAQQDAAAQQNLQTSFADRHIGTTSADQQAMLDVVGQRAPDAIVCIDTFHVIGWATSALDEVRRTEWNKLRRTGAAKAAKEFKGLRFLLRRNWEHLTMGQRETIWALEAANRRTFRAFQLKEELRDIFALPLIQARAALDSWLAAQIAGTPYDLVLMDVQMPDLDGIEATRQIRAHEVERSLARTRILALTANTLVEDRYACFEAGMDGFLVKPLDRDKLAEALDGLKPVRMAV